MRNHGYFIDQMYDFNLHCINRDVQELVPRRQEEDQANVTPDSSLTTNSKSDPDNSVLLFQVMWFDKLNNFPGICRYILCSFHLYITPLVSVYFDRKCLRS